MRFFGGRWHRRGLRGPQPETLGRGSEWHRWRRPKPALWNIDSTGASPWDVYSTGPAPGSRLAHAQVCSLLGKGGATFPTMVTPV